MKQYYQVPDMLFHDRTIQFYDHRTRRFVFLRGFLKLRIVIDERYTKDDFSQNLEQVMYVQLPGNTRTYYRISFFKLKKKEAGKQTTRFEVPTQRLLLELLRYTAVPIMVARAD